MMTINKIELQDKAIESTLSTLNQLGLNMEKSLEKNDIKSNPIVHVQIEFVGDLQGYVILETSPQFSCTIANQMLAGMMTVDKVDDMCMSVLGEICNMISGGLSTNISQLGIKSDIKPPLIDIRDKSLDPKYSTTLKKGPNNEFINTFFLITQYAQI